MTADVGHAKNKNLTDYWLSYTYNVARMFQRAFNNEAGVYVLHGKPGCECIPLLSNAIQNMESEPLEYEKLNPENGSGDYEGALKALKILYQWCVELPLAILEIW